MQRAGKGKEKDEETVEKGNMNRKQQIGKQKSSVNHTKALSKDKKTDQQENNEAI